MIDLSEINTSSREEMRCPNCYHEGLEAHPAFAPDYDNKKAEILKATRCPNSDCKYHSGFQEGEGRKFIQEQYEANSFFKQLLSSSDESNRSLGSLIINGLIIIGLLTMAASFFGVDVASILGGGSDSGGAVTVQGEVMNIDGEPASNISVSLVNESREVRTNENGEFVFENVTYGTYSIAAYPNNSNSSIGIVEQPLSVSNEGVTAQTTIGTGGTVTNNTVSLQLTRVSPQTVSRTLSSNQELTVPLISPQNINTQVPLTVSPLNTTTATDSITLSTESSETVTIPDGFVRDAQIRVTGTPTIQEFSDEFTYNGGSDQFQVYGNLHPKNLVVELSGEATTPSRTISQQVSSGDSVTVDVAGEQTIGPVEIQLSGGQTTAPNSRTGTYTGQNPEVSIDSESAPSQTSITLTGTIKTTNQSYSGTIQGDTLTHDITGTIPATNVVLEFTGGEPINSTVNSQTISASGQGGTTTQQYTLIENAAKSNYTLDIQHTVQQNSNLVSAGYTINGERHEVSTGTKSIQISTEKGDRIGIWVKSERETVPTSSYSHSGGLRILDSEVSRTEINEGEQIGIRATFENPTSSTVYETIQIFKDGEQVQTHHVSLNAGETKQVVFDRTAFSQTGVHSIEVSDGDAIMVSVGGAELSYGVGELSADAVRIGDGGTIAVDTTGDGSFDCQVSATSGSCSLGTVETGTLTNKISQEGVTNTSYTLKYTERDGARDITVDLDNDGSNEINHQGVLEDGETVTASGTLEAGTHTIKMAVGNERPVPYELEWTEAGVVNQPTVTVNGEVVISDADSFKGDRTYTIDALPGGENTFRFESGSGDPYTAQISWKEQSPDTTPQLQVNGGIACEAADFQPTNSCTVPTSMVEPGENTIQFKNGADTFDYTITQSARAVPTQITTTIGNETITLLRDEAVSERSDGAWTARRSITNQDSGEVNISLETQAVTGITTQATGNFSYTYESAQAQQPTISLSNYQGNTSFKVPEDALDADGYLQEESIITIPRTTFTAGENTITVTSENNGSVNIHLEVISSSNPPTNSTETESDTENSSTTTEPNQLKSV